MCDDDTAYLSPGILFASSRYGYNFPLYVPCWVCYHAAYAIYALNIESSRVEPGGYSYSPHPPHSVPYFEIGEREGGGMIMINILYPNLTAVAAQQQSDNLSI